MIHPEHIFETQVRKVLEEVEKAVIANWDEDLEEPLSVQITSLSVAGPIKEATSTLQAGSIWHTDLVEIDGRHIIRILDADFEKGQWYCRIGSNWRSPDDEKHEVEIFTLTGPQKMTACAACAAEANTQSLVDPSTMMGGPIAEA